MNLKRMVTILLVVVMLVGSSQGVLAAGYQTATAIEDPTINIRLNDENIISRDVNGNPVFPVVYNNSTYLPVRGIAQAAGLIPGWDGVTQTVKLDTDPNADMAQGTKQIVTPSIDKNSTKYTTINENENNDDRYTAQLIPELPVAISGVIDDKEGSKTDGDDFYQFSIPSEGLVRIDLENNMEVNAELYVYGENSTAYVAEHNSDIYDVRTINQILKKGNYIVQVKNADTEGNYSLKLAFLPLGTETEDNDTRETAYSIKSSTKYYGYLDGKDNASIKDTNDYYSFEISEAQYVTINTTALDSTNPELYLYADNSTSYVGYDNSGIKTNRFVSKVLQAGKYIIQVKNADSMGYYSLKVETVPPEKAEKKQVTVTIRPDISIIINGQPFTAKDAGGNVIYPIIINGSTYLPVRSVGQAVGINVGWDSSIRTVLMAHNPTDNLLKEVNNTFTTTAEILEAEDNDTRYTAQAIKLVGSLSGVIDDKEGSKTDGQDYYTIEVPFEGELTIKLTSDQATNPELYMYGGHATSYVAESNNGIQSERVINPIVQAGTYIILVKNADNTGSYKLETSFKAFSQQGEDNDTRFEATVIDLNTTVKGYLDGMDSFGNTDTSDYYKVTIFDMGTLTITSTAYTTINPEMYLYSMDSTSYVGYDNAGIFESRTISKQLQPGVYYIQLKNADSEGEYQLEVSFKR